MQKLEVGVEILFIIRVILMTMIIIQQKNIYNIGTQSTSISPFVVTRKMMKTTTNAKLISSILAYSQRASAVCEIP